MSALVVYIHKKIRCSLPKVSESLFICVSFKHSLPYVRGCYLQVDREVPNVKNKVLKNNCSSMIKSLCVSASYFMPNCFDNLQKLTCIASMLHTLPKRGCHAISVFLKHPGYCFVFCIGMQTASSY